MDLTDSISVKKAVETVIQKEGRIDVLINNAGMHTGGPSRLCPKNILNSDGYQLLWIGGAYQEVLPFMRKQGGGLIINFSSIGGLMGLRSRHFIPRQICCRRFQRSSKNGG